VSLTINRWQRAAKTILLLAGILAASPIQAQQMQRFGDYELHYIIIPTTTLQPEIAQRYDIQRGKDRALCNISIIDKSGKGVRSNLEGDTQNLLGQRQDLGFTEVVDGDAVYYLAIIRHADEEVHRLNIDVQTPDGIRTNLRFNQKLYWAE
jgi:hypothetical protein